jgi:pimeloyl-ACP methyl ester carboxylesterase
MPMNPRRSVVLAAAASTVLMVLSGCTLFPSTPVGRPAATNVPAGLEEVYGQSLAWHGCGDGMRCTTVKAPVNWDAPADGSIDLAVVRHKAAGTSLGSLLVNPGGPGGSGFDFVSQGLSYAVSSTVADNYDIVGWDPRGVGQSTPVTCYTDPKATDKTLYGTFAHAYDTQGWIDELTVEEKSFGAACEKNTGELLAHVDSVSTAKDMDLIRALLGDAKLNYLGYSYGTFLGTVYAELFPGNVGRLVLDGALDPQLSALDELKVQMAGFDGAFRAYMTYCLQQSECPFTGSVDEALAQARGVLDTVDSQGLVNSDGRVLDSATLGTAIGENLYSQNYWPDETSMFNALRQGDPSEVFVNADYYNSRNPDGSYSGNSFEVYTAVNCLDGDFVDDPRSTLDGIAEIDAAAPILGKYFAYDDYAVLDTACNNWPVPKVTLPTVFDAAGAAPILVIGTTNDPATPLAWAQSLAKQLSSGVLITHTGEGHTAYNQGNTCVDDAVDNYFVKGTVPAVDPMC